MTRKKLEKVMRKEFDDGGSPKTAVRALLKFGTKDEVLLACVRMLEDLYVPMDLGD